MCGRVGKSDEKRAFSFRKDEVMGVLWIIDVLIASRLQE